MMIASITQSRRREPFVQNFDRHRPLLVFHRFPDLGFRDGDVEKVQNALQDGCSPWEKIFRLCHPMCRGDGRERLRQRVCEASL